MKNNWQPVETAPKDRWILCFRPSQNQIIVLKWNYSNGWSGPFAMNIKISHWMELPECPN